MLPVAVINKHHGEKQLRGEKGLLGLQVTVHYQGTPRDIKGSGNLKQNPERKTAFQSTPRLTCSDLYYSAWASPPRVSTAHSGLVPPK